jgi:hypothetical protein
MAYIQALQPIKKKKGKDYAIHASLAHVSLGRHPIDILI